MILIYRFMCWRRRRSFNKVDSTSQKLFRFMGIDPESMERKELSYAWNNGTVPKIDLY